MIPPLGDSVGLACSSQCMGSIFLAAAGAGRLAKKISTRAAGTGRRNIDFGLAVITFKFNKVDRFPAKIEPIQENVERG